MQDNHFSGRILQDNNFFQESGRILQDNLPVSPGVIICLYYFDSNNDMACDCDFSVPMLTIM